MNKVIEASQDLFMFFISFFTFLYFLWLLWICFKDNKDSKNDAKKDSKNDVKKDSKNDVKKDSKNDPFIMVFRKTRTESLIISNIEEISKTRDIQVVVSCYYYNNEKSIKGCVYVITSKVIYKLFFIKTSLIIKEVHRFNNFISPQNNKNKSYYNIINFLDTNENFEKQRHHTEFFTWPHYYLTDNYIVNANKLENFLKTF